jgi:hypothetical protein
MHAQVFNEGDSPFFEVNTSPHSESLAALGEEDAAESLMKYSVNGYTYCNLPGLTMNAGERYSLISAAPCCTVLGQSVSAVCLLLS